MEQMIVVEITKIIRKLHGPESHISERESNEQIKVRGQKEEEKKEEP